VDFVSIAIITVLWIVSMVSDLHLTTAHKEYIHRHEHSMLLRWAYSKSPRHAIPMTICAESSCVILLPVMISMQPSASGSVAVAFLFCLLHSCAILSNEKFVMNHQEPGSDTL